MKKFLTVIAVLSALALTGCAKADTAASIGDITITQAQAQSKINELLAERAKIDTAGPNLKPGTRLTEANFALQLLQQCLMKLRKS